MTGEISLYFHIPFCTRKCPYCHFFVLRDDAEKKRRFLNLLLMEWEQKKSLVEGKTIASVYFGGGTPSLMPASFFEEILSLFDCKGEITMEANPESLGPIASGINRLSIGVQSFDDRELQRLGRTHSAKEAIDAIETSLVKNISIDLMYDTPHQTWESWKHTLSIVPQLDIQHLSLYNLQIEAPSAFARKKSKIEATQPSSEDSRRFLDAALQCMEDAGLQRYEISAFAKPGFESKHNLGYWYARPFLGFGPSAFSYWNGARFQNHCNLKAWADDLENGVEPIAFSEKLEPIQALRERICIGIRPREGITLPKLDPETKQRIQALIDTGFLKLSNKKLSLTDLGYLYYDTVASELI